MRTYNYLKEGEKLQVANKMSLVKKNDFVRKRKPLVPFIRTQLFDRMRKITIK